MHKRSETELLINYVTINEEKANTQTTHLQFTQAKAKPKIAKELFLAEATTTYEM